MQAHLGISPGQIYEQAMPPYDGSPAPATPKLGCLEMPSAGNNIPELALPPTAHHRCSTLVSVETGDEHQDAASSPSENDAAFTAPRRPESVLPGTQARVGTPITVSSGSRSFSFSDLSAGSLRSFSGSTLKSARAMAEEETRMNIARSDAWRRAMRAQMTIDNSSDTSTLADHEELRRERLRIALRRQRRSRERDALARELLQQAHGATYIPYTNLGISFEPRRHTFVDRALIEDKKEKNRAKLWMAVAFSLLIIGTITASVVVHEVNKHESPAHH